MRLIAVLAIAGVMPLAAQTTRVPGHTASIAGRIIQSDGLAAENARIAVYAVRDGAAAAIIGTATSSYDGRYEVTRLPPGEVMIGVTPQRLRGFGGDVRRVPRPAETLYPGVTDRSKAHSIMVYEGVPAEGIDIWLEPAPQRYSIAGQIFWPAGIDVDHLVIEYGGAAAPRHGIWYVTDPLGQFTIDDVAEGDYVLLARAETKGGPLLGIASTDVASGSVEDVRIMLRQPGSIEGRIVGDRGVDVPFDGLQVTPTQTLLTLSPLYPAEPVSVDGSGRFQIPNAIGEYTLGVTGLPAGWHVRRLVRDALPLVRDRVVVSPGERVTALDIVVGSAESEQRTGVRRTPGR